MSTCVSLSAIFRKAGNEKKGEISGAVWGDPDAINSQNGSLQSADFVQPSPPATPFRSPLDIRYRTVKVDGADVSIGETVDFSNNDPWSQLVIGAVQELRNEKAFHGNVTILEAGVGDGRNLLQAIGIGKDGGDIDKEWTGRVIGLDIDPRRVALARSNFAAVGLSPETYDVLDGDAVGKIKDYAEQVQAGLSLKLSGVAIACLPQAPLDSETKSSADGFNEALASLRRVQGMTLRGQQVADYGLTLNAAWLTELRDCVDEKDFRLLIVISDRVPRDVVAELLLKTRWEEIRYRATPEPVRQDPDTSVQYIVDSRFDDGDEHASFYEHYGSDGAFRKLSAEEAELRRKAFVDGGQQGELNVYHYVFAYLLKPKIG